MRLLPLALALALLAGCFGGGDAPNERRFSATGGSVTAGWAYGGTPVVGSGAQLDGFTNNEANTGSINVSFLLDEESWTIQFGSFSEAAGKTFQDGGVAYDIEEHGESGIGDAAIPMIHASVAAWGGARVLQTVTLVTQEPWTAHLMISKDTVRGADGKITKADGTTPYDPRTPNDARRIEGDAQAILFVKHPRGENFTRGSVALGANLTCQGPQCTQSAELPIEDGAKTLGLNLTFLPAGPLPLAVGRATYRIVDANGTALDGPREVQVVPGPTPILVSIADVPLKDAIAPISLVVTGDGAFTVQAVGTVAYDDHPFLVITWNDVTLT